MGSGAFSKNSLACKSSSSALAVETRAVRFYELLGLARCYLPLPAAPQLEWDTMHYRAGSIFRNIAGIDIIGTVSVSEL